FQAVWYPPVVPLRRQRFVAIAITFVARGAQPVSRAAIVIEPRVARPIVPSAQRSPFQAIALQKRWIAVIEQVVLGAARGGEAAPPIGAPAQVAIVLPFPGQVPPPVRGRRNGPHRTTVIVPTRFAPPWNATVCRGRVGQNPVHVIAR